jgi:glycosyltransferase involved in cell wall biosynthesis
VKSLHVAMLCSNYPPHSGGLEVAVQALATGLARRHRVTIITAAWGEAPRVEQSGGIEIHRLPALHRSERWGVPYPIPVGPGVARALRAIRSADVFHAHGALYANSVLAAYAARRAQRPFVITEHVGMVPYRQRALNLIQRAAWATVGDAVIDRSAAVAVLNQRVRAWLNTRYPGKPVQYIGNGVDSIAFRPRPKADLGRLRRAFNLPADNVLVLFAGRSSEKKNLEVLLKMRHEGYTLVTCGADDRRSTNGVIDLGIIPYARMPDLFACVDLMVLPSMGEGFPLAAQEAMACGVPLVLLWDEGYAGWLTRDTVLCCDTINELEPAIRRLARDPEARAKLSAVERSWASSKWSWDQTIARYEALYEQCLSGSVAHERAVRGGVIVGGTS